MARFIYTLAVACFGLALADPTYYHQPLEHRSDVATVQDLFPVNAYDYTIVPAHQSNDYAVTEYAPEVSLWDYVPNPITALSVVGSTALSVVKCLLPKLALVAVGAALVIGVCALTPYCTLILQKPFSRKLKSLSNDYPYFRYAEDFVVNAYNKYKELQD